MPSLSKPITVGELRGRFPELPGEVLHDPDAGYPIGSIVHTGTPKAFWRAATNIPASVAYADETMYRVGAVVHTGPTDMHLYWRAKSVVMSDNSNAPSGANAAWDAVSRIPGADADWVSDYGETVYPDALLANAIKIAASIHSSIREATVHLAAHLAVAWKQENRSELDGGSGVVSSEEVGPVATTYLNMGDAFYERTGYGRTYLALIRKSARRVMPLVV